MEKVVTYTIKEAADFLGVSPKTIYRLEKKGALLPVKDARGRKYFAEKELEKVYQKTQSAATARLKEKITAYKTTGKTEPYFQEGTILIYHDDFLTTNCIRKESIDLIVTSPPYNVGIKYNTHDDTISYQEYLSFTKRWLTKSYQILKEDGRFCLNIPLDKNKGGQQSVYADITTIAKQIGFKYHSTIIWNEQNISRRTAWGSWLSASAPYVIAPVEVIVILYKSQWKKLSGSGKSDITKEEFMEWTNGVWNFPGESKTRVGHPAPFPVELPRRCIKLFSFVGDTVLDPFLGSGSTLIACVLTNRKGIGIEIDKNYCELAKQRLIKEVQIRQLRLKPMGEI